MLNLAPASALEAGTRGQQTTGVPPPCEPASPAADGALRPAAPRHAPVPPRPAAGTPHWPRNPRSQRDDHRSDLLPSSQSAKPSRHGTRSYYRAPESPTTVRARLARRRQEDMAAKFPIASDERRRMPVSRRRLRRRPTSAVRATRERRSDHAPQGTSSAQARQGTRSARAAREDSRSNQLQKEDESLAGNVPPPRWRPAGSARPSGTGQS